MLGKRKAETFKVANREKDTISLETISQVQLKVYETTVFLKR